MDFAASMNISIAVVMTMGNQPQSYANLVEYCLGDATTQWGKQRIADGHPATYWPYAWEIGNEQVWWGGGGLRARTWRVCGSPAETRRVRWWCRQPTRVRSEAPSSVHVLVLFAPHPATRAVQQQLRGAG